MNSDTIVAIATPPGRGGVGIIRISGPLSCLFAKKITQNTEITPRTAHFRTFFGLDGEIIDQGLVLFFKSPHSFTGEDVVELQVHGSPLVLDYLLKDLVKLGARLAKPGEFSERAFLNNKMDNYA